jgi:hypothetical protein
MAPKIQTIEELADRLIGIPEPIFKVTVHRTEPEKYAGYLDTIDVFGPNDASPGALIELFGGGKYTLRIKDAKGRYVGHRTITICGEPLQKGRPSRGKRLNDRETANLKAKIDQLKAAQKRLNKKFDALAIRLGMESSSL